MRKITRKEFIKNSSLALAGAAAFGLTPQQAYALRQIKFWLGLGATQGDPMIEFGKRAAKKYGYNVVYDNLVGEADTKFAAAFGANDLPDLFETDSPYIAGFLGIDALDPMDDLVKAVNYPLHKMMPFLVNRSRFGGKLFALPHGWNSWVLLYNQNHLDKAGLPTDREPENFDEWLEWAKKMTLRDGSGYITQSGFMCPISGVLPNNIWGAMLYQYGGSMVTDDGKKTNFNNEAGRKACEFILNCIHKWEITDPKITQRYDYWLTGMGSMFYSGTWIVGSSLAQNDLKNNFSVNVMPILGDKRAVMYEYSGLVLPYGRPDEVKVAAGNIFKYYAEHAGEFAVASSQIPVTKEGLEFSGYVNSPHKKHFKASEENGKHAFWDVSHPAGAEFSVYAGNSSAVNRYLDKVWDKSKSVDEGLNDLDQFLSKILRKQPAAAYGLHGG